ncbi:MAG: cell division protein SepF [Candidatus Nitrosocaldus sp.]|nr:cell division protein SepF [Candidatus Nitrosocaldus sp.]MCS7140906.1 cell division protein SepF [Candidatus Nitrosocaldus sp.]MDW7999834.1 cell division protein SepF [Candidatus Nitrosocaldus sp.]MDW8274805.1 cell division protein SepF [Candidatus Nitrosocaldus sp.]
MQKEREVSLYLKTVTLRDVDDIDVILDDIRHNNILIIRITPLAQKSVEDLKMVVEELYKFVRSINGDIARLGEERLVITPPGVKIWKNIYDSLKDR